MPIRAKLGLFFLAGWLALSLVCMASMFLFALPRTRQVEIGALENFPPADQPYQVRDPVQAYVVNDGSQVIVIDTHIKTPNSYTAYWNAHERRYIDPLSGAQYDI